MPLTITLPIDADASPVERLGAARVLVAGGSPLGLRVVSMLQKVGVQQVSEAFGAGGDALRATVREHDLIINANQTIGEMIELGDACVAAARPFVWGEVNGNVYRASVFWPQAPGDWPRTTLRDLYPTPPRFHPEIGEPEFPGPELEITWSRLATILVTEVQKLVQGVGEPLIGRVLEADSTAATWQVRTIAEPDADRPAATRPDADQGSVS